MSHRSYLAARERELSREPVTTTYRVVSCLRAMDCDACGARLQLMRVERGPLTTRFVCASHELPAHLVGREVVRVVRGDTIRDVPVAEVREGEEIREGAVRRPRMFSRAGSMLDAAERWAAAMRYERELSDDAARDAARSHAAERGVSPADCERAFLRVARAVRSVRLAASETPTVEMDAIECVVRGMELGREVSS